MGKDRRRERVARSVGLALTAGMVSIIPTAFGAPIQDTSVATTAAIAQGASAVPGAGIDTKITSTVQNNVIGWKDFSVKKDEKVEFDGKNYLNLVTGANTSEINGIVKGGGDVYVVNPNGIIFGKDAQVNVGNLYASTRYVDRAAAEMARAAGDIHSVLATTSAGVAADVVNLGKISATKVEVEGANIRFVSDNVSATGANVTLKADGANGGYIHVGNVNYTGTSTDAPGYTAGSATSGTVPAIETYKTIRKANWGDIQNGLSANYMLTEDIDASSGFAPVTGMFTGKFDGLFHTIKNMHVTAGGGLFKETSNAKIENIGVSNSTIAGGSPAAPAGAIVGHAKDTTLRHVHSEHTTATGNTFFAAALVGRTEGTNRIAYSYADNADLSTAGTMIGTINGGTTYVDHSYIVGDFGNPGPASTTLWGFARGISGATTKLYVQNSYFDASVATNRTIALASGASGNLVPGDTILIGEFGATASASTYTQGAIPPGGAPGSPSIEREDIHRISLYDSADPAKFGWGDDIGNTGGVHIDTATGKVTRPSWRIYEGRALPILTSMTRGIKTVDYRYAYYKKGTGGTYTEQDTAATRYNGGKNGGRDIPASGTNPADGLLYNARFLKIVDEDGKELQDTTSTAGGVAADGNIAQNKAIAFSGDRGTHIFYGQDEGKYGQLHATYDGAQQSRALLWSDQAGYDLVGGNISIAPRTVSVPQKDLKEVVFKKEYDGTANVDASKIAALYEGTSTNVHGILDEDKAAGLVVNTSGITGKYVNPDTTKAQSAAEDWDRPTSYTNADDKQDVGAKKYVHLGGTLTLTSNGSAYTGHDYVINPADAAIDTFSKGLIYQRTLALSTLPAASQKIYDGTADVMTAGNGLSTDTARNFTTADFSMDRTNVHGADDVVLSVSGKAKYVDKQTDGTYQETKKVGTHDIAYTGIKLTGATAGNYTLVYGSEAIYSKKGRLTKDSNWNAAVAPVPSDASTGGTGVLHQAGGKITPRTISRTDYAWYKNVSGILTEQDATRQYNGHTSYTDPVGPTDGRTVRLSSTATPTALGLVGTDDIQFTATAADFTTAQGTGSPLTKNVYNAALGATDGAQAVRYKVTVTGSDAENYAFLDAPTVALKTDGTQYDVYGKGTITPRELKVKAGAAKAVKPYDGDAKVKRGGTGTENLEFGTDDYIVYDDPAKTEAENERYHLVAGDTDKIAYTGIYKQTGTEAAKDVNWDAANHVVLDKDVTYTVTVKNGASPSANYTFVGAASAAPNQVSLDAGKGGRIEQRELTGFRMGDVEKFYDTTAELNGGTDNIVSGKNTNTVDRALKDATATGLVGTDKIWDVFDASKIQGAYGRTAAGTFTENEHVNRDAAQNVIKTAVRYAGTNGAASLADAMKDHNYTLAAGTLQGDGSFVQEKGGKIKPVTLQHVTVTADHAEKVYDGNQNVIAPAGHESEGAAYFLTHHTGTDAGKLHAMTGTSNGHTVHVDYHVVSGAYASKDSHNGALQNVTYKLKAVEKGDYTLDASLKDASGNYSYTAVNGGTITPKTVYASAKRDPLTKVYDAKRAAGVAGDAAVTLEGLIDGTNESTAAYYDKNVGTGKTVTYEVKLDPATQALGNYYIVDRSYTGNDPANHRITQLQTMDNAITPASLTVTFGTPTKEYDGNTNIQNPAQINAQITGLLTGDSGVQDQVTLNPALLSQAKYNDANVGMGKPIDYTLELQGTDAGNYRLASATQKENPTTHAQEWHQTGYGVITKKQVAPGGNPFSVTLAPITKAYDGTDAVAYDHTGWQYGQGGAGAKKTAGDYVNAFTLAGIPLQAANGDYSITSAKYDSPNVGASSAEYTFKISDTIAKNYDFSALSPGVFDNGVYHYTASGASITPQRVVMTLTAPETTKVYNGLRDVVTNAQTNVTGTPVDLTPLVAVSKADQKHDLALTANDLSAQYASKDVQFDGAGNVVAQNVTYKVNLQTNPQNYELYVDATAATSGAGGTIGAIDLIGKGKILQKEIRTITFGDEVEKTYDGTARVTENASGTEPKDTMNQAASTAQSADFVNGETFGQIFDATKLKGYYGTGTNAASFQKDANVLREGGAVSKKTMQYMGRTASGADADIATAITNRNYKMADGVTSIVQEKAGKIKPKQMNFDDAVKVDFGAIQKVYDGSTDVSYNHSAWNRQDTGRMDAKDYIHSVRIGPSAASMTTLDPEEYAAKAAYDSADAGVRTAHYTITLAPAAAQMFNNYELTTAPSSGVSYDPAAHAIKMAHAGQITPQEVVAKAERAATKVYDGTTNLVKGSTQAAPAGTGAIQPLADGYVALRRADGRTRNPDGSSVWGTASPTVTGHYDTKDVVLNPDGTVGEKTVSYTASAGSNYKLIDAADPSNAAIGTLSFTGKGRIEQKEIRTIRFGDEVEKVYDGTAVVTENASGADPKDTMNQAASAAQSADFVNGETFGQIFDATKLKGYYGTGTNAASFQKDANVLREGGAVSKKTMQYMGRTASGADADIATAITNRNYKMADGVTSIVQQQAGKIKPKQVNIADVIDVDFGTLEKVYDGKTDVGYDTRAWNRQNTGRKTAKDFINAVNIGPAASSRTALAAGDYQAAANYDSADVGAHTAAYTITLSEHAAKLFDNYDPTGTTGANLAYDPATRAITVSHAGQITPQEVVAKAERAATKVYDGTTNLVKGSTQAAPAGTGAIQPLADGYVALRRADGRTRNPDGSSVWGTASPTVTGHYDTKDVVLNPDGTVGEKTVSYTASAGSNYKLIDAADPSNTAIGTLSFTGKGRIEQKQIEVKFGRMEKEYDGSADATPANLSDAIPTTPPIGAVNGDAFDDIFDRSRIKGYYGDVYGNGTLVPDASVRRDANHHVIDKVTAFTDSATGNIADALKRNPNGVSNYALAGNPKAIAGVGKIAPHAIHTSDVRVHYDPISRAYDGTRYGLTNTDFSENQDAERGHLKLTTTINGASVDLQYDLGRATFDDANVGTNKTVTYHMNGLAEQDLGNYAVESGFGAWLNNPANWQFPGNTITPRKIAHNEVAKLTKTYDGTNYVSPIDPATHAPILDTATHLPLAIEPARTKDGGDYETATQFRGILAGDAGMVRTVITNAAYDDSKAGSRTVNYTAEILGDTHGNYAFADAAATTPHTISYQGAGEIQKRKLTIRGNVLGLDRAYDQTEHVDAAGRTRIEDVLDDPANWSGLVTVNGATDDVRLKTDPSTGDASFDAYYVRANDRTPDRHVRRDADGTVQEKDIVVDNIQVEGNDAGNYELSSEIRASGKITPKVLTSAVTDPAEKVYDGTSALRNPQAKIHVEGAVMMPTGRPEDVGLQVEGTFAHADASGQITNADAKNVDDANRALYHISIANGDYALDPSYAMQEDLSGAGRITPYTLKATARTATKTYDGDTALRADGDGAVLPQDGAGYYLDVDKPAFDDAALGVTATSAGYGNKDAGSYAILYENLALTNNAHGNYALEADPATGLPKAVQGKGVIEKRKLSLTDADPVSKVYDGTDTLLSYDRNTNRNETVTAKDKFHIRGLRNVVPGEENDVFEDIAITGKFASRHAGNQGVQYDLHLAARSAKNYDLPETYTGAGTITPRTIGVQADPTKTPQKVYDAGRDLPDAQAYLVAANGADPINKILAGDRVGVASAKGTFRDPNVAGTPGANRVDYTHIALDNPDYQLANDALPDQPGTITRRPLRVKAKPQIRVLGEDLTGFAPGTVSGWATPADKEALEGAFEWGPAPGAKQPVVPGLYGLYGTYHGQLEGDFDRNYTFDQEPANRTALMIGPNRAYYAATADGLLRPDRTVYTQASKDRTSDYARVPKYDVGYTAGGAGNGRTTEPIARDTTVEHERGEQHPIFARKAAFGIEGEDAVNLDGGDRATRDQAEASLAR